MENLIKELLVGQIREKHITVRSIQSQIDKMCEYDKSLKWMSVSTIERRLQHPLEMSEEELFMMRDAVRHIVSDSMWLHIRRHITERIRYNYANQISLAVNKGFALHQKVIDYDNWENDDSYIKRVLSFFRDSPPLIQKWWLTNLNTYLRLPDLAKASILCGSYIGHSCLRNSGYNAMIMKFIDYFPFLQGVNSIVSLDDDNLSLLGDILKVSANTLDNDDIPELFYRYACEKDEIMIDAGRDSLSFGSDDEKRFCQLAVNFKHSVTDFFVDERDFLHDCCFILYVDKTEWLLAYVTSVFYFRLKAEEDRYRIRREYHDRGCTGFRFTDKELDYLCELLHVINKKAG